MSKRSQTLYGTGHFNMPLYHLREKTNLTQEEFGKLIGGYNGNTIMRIENGISGGKLNFWQALQKHFQIPDELMWAYMNGVDFTKAWYNSKEAYYGRE